MPGATLCECDVGFYLDPNFHECFPCTNLDPLCLECSYDVAALMGDCTLCSGATNNPNPAALM